MRDCKGSRNDQLYVLERLPRLLCGEWIKRGKITYWRQTNSGTIAVIQIRNDLIICHGLKRCGQILEIFKRESQQMLVTKCGNGKIADGDIQGS